MEFNLILESFLKDVAQGIWGDTNLTYSEIHTFIKKSNEEDVEMLKEMYWDWTSLLTEENEVDVDELVNLIREVNLRK